MSHAQMTVEIFGGFENECFHLFEQIICGYVDVSANNLSQQVNFLKFHLRDKTLRFNQNFPEATQLDLIFFHDEIDNHFCLLEVQEKLVFKLEQEKFDPN